MTCDAPESELLTFLAAGTLSGPERGRALAHVAGCPACQDELAASRGLFAGLREAHLTPEEVVTAAWEGGHEAHLSMCARCRAEVEELRRLDGHLIRAGGARVASPASRARSWALPLAAALLLALGLAWWWRRAETTPESPRERIAATPKPAPETAIAAVTPSLAPLPPRALVSLALVPGLTRGGGELPVARRGTGAADLRLTLHLEEDFGLPSYRVELAAVDGGPVWSREGVGATSVDGGPALVVDVPLERLPGGDYRVGVVAAEEGREETLASYAFRVRP